MIKEDWEFNVLGIYNYKISGPLEYYFQFIIENHDRIEGDLVEAGVFQGRSLLALGLLLKEIGSSKVIYGFDSFAGFPPVYHENDDIKMFDNLLADKRITQQHYDKFQKNIKYRSLSIKNPSVKNLSMSGDFSSSNIDIINKKMKMFKLDNIHLVPGAFVDTFTNIRVKPSRVMAALLDCDLYSSYKMVLPFVWQRLSKGGYIFLDEYYSLKFPGARIATDEYFADKKEKPFMHELIQGDFERWGVRKLMD